MKPQSSNEPYPTTTTSDEVAEPTGAGYDQRARRAVELLRQWSAEEDGYDDEIWPLLKEELEDHRLVIR